MAGSGSMIRVILAIVWVSTASVCAYKRTGQGLAEIPTDIPPDETEVDLSDNQISDTTRLSDLTSLVKVSLNFNKISAFPNLARSGSTLLTLNLRENEISEVPIALLHDLTSLRYVNLGENRLTEFPDFSPVASSLVTLYLFDNSIVHNDLVAERLNPLIHLRTLSLNSNTFPEMPDLGEACREMFVLQFRNMEMTSIDPETLRYCTLVRFLNISDNYLVSFPDLKYLGASLKTLDITRNQLATVDDALTSTLQSLEVVNMDDNQLTSFPNFCGSSGTLTDLSLRGNKLTTVDEKTLGCLLHLVNLTLSFNELSTIPDSPGLTLQRLDLQHNLFLSMPVFKTMGQNITVLYMNNNPMKMISDEAISVLESIEFLYIQGSKVEALPDIVPAVDTLHTLIISTQDDPTPISAISAGRRLFHIQLLHHQEGTGYIFLNTFHPFIIQKH
jgi:Leucine-rich repeat (LRR) protein